MKVQHTPKEEIKIVFPADRDSSGKPKLTILSFNFYLN